jgi:hypothetical protein
MTLQDLRHSAVIHLSKRQDVNKLAEKLYHNNFIHQGKIIIREAFRDNKVIVHCVSDTDEIQKLYLVKQH